MKKHPFDTPIDLLRVGKLCKPWPSRGRFGLARRHMSRLHLHWPYGDKIVYQGGLYGRVHLKKINKPLNCFKMKREELIRHIYREVAHAMYYPVVYRPEFGFEHQAIEAFSMYHLIANGWSYWQAPGEIPKPWLTTATADAKRHQRREHPSHDSVSECAKYYMAYWPKHGRYVNHRPPIDKMTRRELEAVYVIVCDSFENQC